MDVLRDHASLARTAGHFDTVYKSECMLCFRSPEQADGLYVNLSSFQGLCQQHLDFDAKRGACPLYLCIKHTREPIKDVDENEPKAAPSSEKLVLDFAAKPKESVEEHVELAVRHSDGAVRTLPLDDPSIPTLVSDSVASIQAHDSAETKAQTELWEEERRVSKYAQDLPQLPAERKIAMDPEQWRCDFTGATDNLWLNLSTGKIGSGRQQPDGSGGNGAALRHYFDTGKQYPLAVKLGTITPTSADVYSYASDEDDMVTDLKLSEHLAHWGINVMQMEKTEKTMAELEHEQNMAFEFDAITEAGAHLDPVFGKGLMGLKNLGNSCYVNSVVQLLWAIPELQERYLQAASEILYSTEGNPAQDFLTQFTKLGMALSGSDPFGDVSEHPHSVAPVAFKALAGKGHHDFASGRQQDTQHYFSHLLELVARAEHASNQRLPPGHSTKKLFEFATETRIECLTSHRVSYKVEKGTTLLSLEIPLEAAVNVNEVAASKEREQKRQKFESMDPDSSESSMEKVLPKVPFTACLDKYAAAEMVENYRSAILGIETQASKSTRFASFPKYLMVHLRRYYLGPDWTPKKLEVLVDMPDRLSLQNLRAIGQQPGEELQPEEEGQQAEEANVAVVSQLAAMGFPERKCKKAALATGNANVEAAMEWLLLHGDFETEKSDAIDSDTIRNLESMGFPSQAAEAALIACDGDINRAVEWLFSRADEMPAAGDVSATANLDDADTTASSGNGHYELVGFISHIGSNTACGHYVCHIKKAGRWIIFNDEKVAISAKPPRDLGYMYLYKQSE